jgi:hypothetical protein
MRLDRVVDARTGARYLPQTQTLRATSIQLVVVRGSGGDARGGAGESFLMLGAPGPAET